MQTHRNIDPADLQTASQSLQTELRNSLLARLPESRLPGFVLYDSAVAVSFTSLPATAQGDDLATIVEKATLHVPIFKVSDLATFIARDGIRGYDGAPVTITEPQALTFEYTSATSTLSDLSQVNELTFNLKGRAPIVWEFDAAALQKDMAGLPRDALASYLRDQRSLNRASAVIKPVWSRHFPENPEDITIETVLNTTATETSAGE